MSDTMKKKRAMTNPALTNIHITQILGYRMPLAALVSILHRISGAFMFLLFPAVLYLLEQSLRSEISFAHFKSIASHWFVKLVLLGLVWAYLHHLCAGIRHLIMDLHYGLTKEGSRRSSVAVLSLSLAVTALIALKLFGAF